MKPSLILLAAGMGSRYGGLKQMDGFGPNGETIMDYSIYDAIRSGFGKIVFVVRADFHGDIEAYFAGKFDDKVEVHYINQKLSDLPGGFKLPRGREKPWGTAHAVWACRKVINEPFGVINADDFYGKEAFEVLHDELASIDKEDECSYCTVSYFLKNTLSDHGVVNRGVCKVSPFGELIEVNERTKIKRLEDGRVVYNYGTELEQGELDNEALVSMNMWGFVPAFFKENERMFSDFLNERINEEKSEFYIPEAIQTLMDEGKAEVKVKSSNSQWFGVTYKEDKPVVQESISQLIADGKYPSKLW